MRTRYGSFFWPAVLILVGLVALLVNTGQIPTEKLILLVNLWPVILIVIGLEIIVRRSLHGAVADLAAALVVVVAVAGSAVYLAVSPSPTETTTFEASAPLEGLRQASLEVDAGDATITVSSSGDLGSDLYHAHVSYSGPRTVSAVASNGMVVISQSNNTFFGLGNPRMTLDVQLNSSIPWSLKENTGASNDNLNIPQLHVHSITINTGASREEITLGSPSGVVPVEINGGALTVRMHRPSGAEVSVAVSGGAINLDADGRSSHAVGSLTYETSGFAGASDAYRIAVHGGACNITLDTSTESG